MTEFRKLINWVYDCPFERDYTARYFYRNLSVNGYLYVASKHAKYLTSAMYSAETLRDYYPEAQIAIVTEPSLYNEDLIDVFDKVIVGPEGNSRLKLWGLSHSPWKNTLYIDADCTIHHPDIANVFDLLGDNDIMLSKIRSYAGAFVHFPGGELSDHCGVILYNNKKHTIRFMSDWWQLWLKQESGEWKWDTDLYPDKELRPWDQWSFWWLINKHNYGLKKEYFPEPDARWNFVSTYKPEECPREDVVIYHHTIDLKR